MSDFFDFFQSDDQPDPTDVFPNDPTGDLFRDSVNASPIWDELDYETQTELADGMMYALNLMESGQGFEGVQEMMDILDFLDIEWSQEDWEDFRDNYSPG